MNKPRPARPQRIPDRNGWYTCPTCQLRLWYANPCTGVTCVECILSDRGPTPMVWSDDASTEPRQ